MISFFDIIASKQRMFFILLFLNNVWEQFGDIHLLDVVPNTPKQQ